MSVDVVGHLSPRSSVSKHPRSPRSRSPRSLHRMSTWLVGEAPTFTERPALSARASAEPMTSRAVHSASAALSARASVGTRETRSSPHGWYRAPTTKVTPRALPTAPAIPVPDEAWGYDEDASGNLRLLRPRFPPGTAVGPGSYDPNFEATSMLRTGPSIDFAHVSERQQPRAQATEAAAEGMVCARR